MPGSDEKPNDSPPPSANPPVGAVLDHGGKARDATQGATGEMLAAAREDAKRLEASRSEGTASLPSVFQAVLPFFSSGIFFILLGGALLYIAQHDMATNHAGITFVLVVLGTALLLYGTGTQGMGQYKSDTAAGYNVAIAGGAGIVAFAVAYGIIEYSPKMRDAFQPEKKFVKLLIQSDDGSTSLPLYAASFDIDGVSIPSAQRGKLVEVYVPYLSYELRSDAAQSEAAPAGTTMDPDPRICKLRENAEALARASTRAATKTISAVFYRVIHSDHDDTLKATEATDFRIKFDQSFFDSTGGGSDYPVYPVRMCVNLQSIDTATKIIANAFKQDLKSAPGTAKPDIKGPDVKEILQ